MVGNRYEQEILNSQQINFTVHGMSIKKYDPYYKGHCFFRAGLDAIGEPHENHLQLRARVMRMIFQQPVITF